MRTPLHRLPPPPSALRGLRPQILAVSRTTATGSAEAAKLLRSRQLTTRREAEEAEKRRPKFVRPAAGEFTSGYGGRWGTLHLGIDIAGPIGTPIYSVADGVVKEAGTASGFGHWVRRRSTRCRGSTIAASPSEHPRPTRRTAT